MNIICAVLKWTGITLGIAVVSLVGFIVAACLSPGNPGRSYVIAGLSLAALALVFRFLFPDNHEPPANVRFPPIADNSAAFQTTSMDEQHPRQFSQQERAFLVAVAERLPAKEGQRLQSDIRTAQVIAEGDFLLVYLPGYERPEYRGHHNLPFEGKMRAADGGAVSVLVNMDENDRLLAMEFILWESASDVPLDWATLEVVPEPPIGVSQW